MIEITFLGTTAGVPTKQRAHAAIALRYEGEIILFDCGEGTQRQMAFARLSPMKVSNIFITHWHADHFAGLMGLVQSLSLQRREDPLCIYGPQKTKDFVKCITEETGYFNPTFDIKAKSKREGVLLKKDKYSVSAIKARHPIPSFSYKFSETDKPGRFDLKKAQKLGLNKEQYGTIQRGKSIRVGKRVVKPSEIMGPKRRGKSVVYSGDTSYNTKLIPFSKDADLLIHEATYANELLERARDVEHSTARGAAEIAKKANVKKLVLTHISGRYNTPRPILEDAKKVFKNVEVAHDLLKVYLK